MGGAVSPLILWLASAVQPSYKYLGIWLDEHLNYQNCATAIAESARKALGLLISNSVISPLKPSAHYTNHWWFLGWTTGQGFGASKPSPSFKPSRTKQFTRHVMGVGKNCPVDLLKSDSGWVPVPCRHQFEMHNFGITLLQWMIVGLLKRFLVVNSTS